MGIFSGNLCYRICSELLAVYLSALWAGPWRRTAFRSLIALDCQLDSKRGKELGKCIRFLNCGHCSGDCSRCGHVAGSLVWGKLATGVLFVGGSRLCGSLASLEVR